MTITADIFFAAVVERGPWHRLGAATALVLGLFGLTACGQRAPAAAPMQVLKTGTTAIADATVTATATTATRLEAWSSYFAKAHVLAGPTEVDCTLSGGTRTRCVSITFKSEPKSHAPGPWCPRQVSDGPERSGIWFGNGLAVAADGAFMKGLAARYKDNNWQMVDAQTGKIKVTETAAQCQGAARPDVGPEYMNFCVECRPEFFPNGLPVTYVIPLRPGPLGDGSATQFAGAGVALDGVRLDGPAPVQAILGAYTIAPIDRCGGHVNPHAGYHYHAVTDCLVKEALAATHGVEIGLAMDGHKILANVLADGSKPTDLDRCNGHKTSGLDYHYHAGAAGANAILGCLRAEHGCALTDGAQVCDAAAARPPRPPGASPPGRPQGASTLRP
jgi:YHYH protein